MGLRRVESMVRVMVRVGVGVMVMMMVGAKQGEEKWRGWWRGEEEGVKRETNLGMRCTQHVSRYMEICGRDGSMR